MSVPAGAGAPASDRASPGDRVALGLSLAAAAGVVAVLFHVDYLPTLDAPFHLLAGYLENHFDDPGAGWPAWLQRGNPFTALGGPSTGDAFCEGADASGRLHVAPQDRAGQTLVCRIALPSGG